MKTYIILFSARTLLPIMPLQQLQIWNHKSCNISLVKDLTKNNHGEVIRLSLLSSHYRQALDWNDNVVHQAKKLLDKLYKILADIKDVQASKINDSSLEFISPLLDDLNTPGLFANLNKMIKDFIEIIRKIMLTKIIYPLIAKMLTAFRIMFFAASLSFLEPKILAHKVIGK